MNWSRSIRQVRRVVSIAFTALVIVNIVLNVIVADIEQLALWVGILTLVPLGLLMIAGLYLFAVPYLAQRSRSQ